MGRRPLALLLGLLLPGCTPGTDPAPSWTTADLQVAFDAGGVRVAARRGPAVPTAFGLRAWGRGEALVPAGGSVPLEGDCDGGCRARVEHARPGLVEWWEDRREGLEHGFTVLDRPLGAGDLVLELAAAGAEVAADGAEARLPGGIRYSGLVAYDERGTSLPARMQSVRGGLRLVVDDARAVGTVTIDPLLTAATTLRSGQAGAELGWSVASAGDVDGDGYDDVIVGAPFYDNGATDEGRAYVFLGSATGLATSPAWTAEPNQAAALFGFSVASAGDVNGDGYDDVLVGAQGYSNGETGEGRAWLYLGSAVGPAAAPAWVAESNQVGAGFGWSVASAGDVNGDGYDDVVVGAPTWDGGNTQEGRASLYLGSSAGLGAVAVWTVESDQDFAELGESVASAGDVNGDGFDDVVVGAPGYTNGESGEGRALLYLGFGGGLQATPAWTAEPDQANAFFGTSVASAGDVDGDGYSDVLAAAYSYSNGQTDEGRTWLYLGSAAGLAAVEAWTAESDQAGAASGWSAAPVGDVNGDGYDDVAVGAKTWDGGQVNEGRVSIHLGSATGLGASPLWTAESDQAEARLGYSVAGAGDTDGDGYADVLAGAYLYDGTAPDEGGAFLYLGSCYDPTDADGDTVGDRCDACEGWDDRLDADLDLAPDDCDLCPDADDRLDDDADGVPDACDDCPTTADPGQLDSDGDTIGNLCDPAPFNASLCGDADLDACDDCTGGALDVATDGLDTDADGLCDAGDLDDDGDTAPDAVDLDPLDAFVCRDTDSDSCDDCAVSGGPPAPSADGLDTDHDGRCDLGDPDDDGDTVADGADLDPLDPEICRDLDADTCDDCRSGAPAPADDGLDTEGDGLCDAGDPDDDDDGIDDLTDSRPLDPTRCADADLDTCDDCSQGASDPAADGADLDGDGLCNPGDDDDDGDTVLDPDDARPLDPSACADDDGDLCDDCRSGLPDVANDGLDTDADGQCDASDDDDDGDAVVDSADQAPLDAALCLDADADGCDDCALGPADPAADGVDTDVDGICDPTDPDDDGDTVVDTNDSDPLDPVVCRDNDADGCDDCAGGSPDLAADGPDADADGVCDAGDDDDDGDGVLDADDPAPTDPALCDDVDADGCDDCDAACVPPLEPIAGDGGESGCGCGSTGPLPAAWGLLAAGLLARRRRDLRLPRPG